MDTAWGRTSVLARRRARFHRAPVGGSSACSSESTSSVYSCISRVQLSAQAHTTVSAQGTGTAHKQAQNHLSQAAQSACLQPVLLAPQDVPLPCAAAHPCCSSLQNAHLRRLCYWTHPAVCLLACEQDVLLHRLAVSECEAEQTSS